MKEMNEFYVVKFDWQFFPFYFKDKDKALAFLWQSYLNDASYETEEEMEAARESLNKNYNIDRFGGVYTVEFED